MVISFQSLTAQLYSTIKLHLLHLKVLSLTPCSYKEIQLFPENTPLELQHLLLQVTLVMLFTMQTQLKVDMLVGFTPLKMTGSDLEA